MPHLVAVGEGVRALLPDISKLLRSSRLMKSSTDGGSPGTFHLRRGQVAESLGNDRFG